MPRYIDADSLYEKLEQRYDGPEVKHGHWVEMVRIRKGRSVRLVRWQCSLCECFLGTNTANYCPNCGAIMDEEDENNEQN